MTSTKVIFQYPEAQAFLANEAKRRVNYFTEGQIRDDRFFRLRSLIYLWLNLFDEAINTLHSDRKLERVYDLEWWERYILDRMRHPMFKEVFKSQSHHWSSQFGSFIEANWKELEKEADPIMY